MTPTATGPRNRPLDPLVIVALLLLSLAALAPLTSGGRVGSGLHRQVPFIPDHWEAPR